MIVSFFESLKYSGHLFPIAFLRVYLGYVYLEKSLRHFQGNFLQTPELAASITEWLPNSSSPLWYGELLENIVVPNWQIFAYLITYFEFIIGISFLVGFLVRPISLLGMILCLNLVYAGAGPIVTVEKTYLVLFLVMAWVGAGRCLGLDYYFFKRQRGIWW